MLDDWDEDDIIKLLADKPAKGEEGEKEYLKLLKIYTNANQESVTTHLRWQRLSRKTQLLQSVLSAWSIHLFGKE